MKTGCLRIVVALPLVMAPTACDPSSKEDDTATQKGDGGDNDDATAGDDDNVTGDDEETEGDDDNGDACDQITPTEGDVKVGSVVQNFTLTDQDGGSVRLYDYCNDTILLFATAAW